MMGVGRPVIISDQYAFSEMPDDCCLKITTGAEEEEELAEALLRLVDDPDKRMSLGETARKYVLSNHDIQSTARQYMEFAVEVLNGNGM